MMDREDQEFLSQMASQLDATIHDLKDEETKSIAGLGEERVRELRMYWNKEFDPTVLEEIRRFIDHDDRKLIWIWSSLARAHARRTIAGHSHMLMSTDLLKLQNNEVVEPESSDKEE